MLPHVLAHSYNYSVNLMPNWTANKEPYFNSNLDR